MRPMVRDVMTRLVLVVRENTPYKELVRMMHAHGLRALPVVDVDRRVIGIVTDTDLLLKTFHEEPRSQPEGMKGVEELSKASAVAARDVMSFPVVVIREEATLPEAATLMHDRRFRHLPVVGAQERLVGIVTPSDLLKVYLRPDEEIRRDVLRHLAHPSITPRAFRVSVDAGVVCLYGEVGRMSRIPLLVSMAASVLGVIRVEDRLSYRLDDSSDATIEIPQVPISTDAG